MRLDTWQIDFSKIESRPTSAQLLQYLRFQHQQSAEGAPSSASNGSNGEERRFQYCFYLVRALFFFFFLPCLLLDGWFGTAVIGLAVLCFSFLALFQSVQVLKVFVVRCFLFRNDFNAFFGGERKRGHMIKQSHVQWGRVIVIFFFL